MRTVTVGTEKYRAFPVGQDPDGINTLYFASVAYSSLNRLNPGDTLVALAPPRIRLSPSDAIGVINHVSTRIDSQARKLKLTKDPNDRDQGLIESTDFVIACQPPGDALCSDGAVHVTRRSRVFNHFVDKAVSDCTRLLGDGEERECVLEEDFDPWTVAQALRTGLAIDTFVQTRATLNEAGQTWEVAVRGDRVYVERLSKLSNLPPVI